MDFRRLDLFWLPGAALSAGVAVRVQSDPRWPTRATVDRCTVERAEYTTSKISAGPISSGLPRDSNCSFISFLALPAAGIASAAKMVCRTGERCGESCHWPASLGNTRGNASQTELRYRHAW